MKNRGWQTKVVTGVLVALVSLIAVADFLPHTDDGCAIEQHCLACRAHISAVTDVATTSTFSLGAHEYSWIETPRSAATLEAPARFLPPGRAPPLSA
ncbi:MAG: hypothetical protein ABI672_15480 [Vicinamibacteria bacterium]